MEPKKCIPSAITILNMSFGMASLLYAGAGEYKYSAVMILIAAALDATDGRVARRLGACSAFGKELDSLADVVSFGVAPAILVFLAEFAHGLFFPGLVVSFLFAACGAIRLARFNLSKLPHFEGVPITVAGGLAGGSILAANLLPAWFYLGIVTILAFLMVSRFRVPKL